MLKEDEVTEICTLSRHGMTYNEERPHDALCDKTPAAYREAIEAGVSTFEVST